VKLKNNSQFAEKAHLPTSVRFRYFMDAAGLFGVVSFFYREMVGE
jgi:hypothetical protein